MVPYSNSFELRNRFGSKKREDFKKDRMKKVKGNTENQFLSEFGPNINGCVLLFSCFPVDVFCVVII